SLPAHHHYRRAALFSRLLRRQGRCPGRRCAASLPHVGRPPMGVFVIGHRIEVRGGAGPGLLVELPKKGNAPATTGTGPAALGKLAGNLGLMHSDELDQLATSDVKAVAYLGVEIHVIILMDSAGSCSIRPLKHLR